MWTFWTDSLEGKASTSPDARHSGYAGLVLTRGAEGNYSLLKQPLPDPDEVLSVVVSLGSEGTAYVDDMLVVRTRRR